MEYYATVGMVAVALVMLVGVSAGLKRQGKEQAEEFNKITQNFNKSLAELNIAVVGLNKSLEYMAKESSNMSIRVKKHGEELDNLHTKVAIIEKDICRIEKALSK